jgi:hypothetical protein
MNTIPKSVAKPLLQMLLNDGNYEGMKRLLNDREVIE